MPRVSRRNNTPDKKNTIASPYRACIYTRLSRERTEEWRNKSGSIESQIEICQAYLNKANIQVKKIYSDYEYSGTNFNRPGYQEMMADIKRGLINCIVIRDLSRLGREHLEMGRLVDKVFPFLGVRFISVVDKIDTANGIDPRLSFEMLIKNLINDMYAKDIGKKIKTSKHNKAKNGFFIGSNPSFGYKVVTKDGGRRLEPDEFSSKVVLKIFQLYNEGESALDIAKYLNENKVATSVAYYKTKNIAWQEGQPKWRKGTVINMLRNKTYVGDLIQATKTTPNGKRHGNYVRKDEKDWIIVENNHEAIVPKELFYEVQKKIDENSKKSYFKLMYDWERDPVNRYKGLIFDGNTGVSLKRIGVKSYRKDYDGYYYKFTNREHNGYVEDCDYISIFEDKLDLIVLDRLRKAVGYDLYGANTKQKIENLLQLKIEGIDKKQKAIHLKLNKLNYDMKLAYEKYSLDEITRDEYIENRRLIREQINSYEAILLEYDKEKLVHKQKAEDELSILQDISDDKILKISEDTLRQYVERIDVFTDSDVKIILKINGEGGDLNE